MPEKKKWYSVKKDALSTLAMRSSFLNEVIPTLSASAFAEEVLFDAALIKLLNSVGVTVNSVPSDVEGIYRVVAFNIGGEEIVSSPPPPPPPPPPAGTAPPPPREPEVKLRNWNGSFSKEEFVKMVKNTLLPAMKRDIHVFVAHGGDHVFDSNTSADKFFIFIWGSPERGVGTRVTVPPVMWRTMVSCHDAHEFVRYPDASEDYVPIVTDEEDTVAVMNDKNLYILFDAIHHGTDDERVILDKILEQTVAVIKNGMKVVEKSPEELKKISDALCETYVKLCMERVNKYHREMKSEVSTLAEKLETNRKEMLEMVARFNRAQKTLATFPEASAEHAGKFAAEWNALLKVPKVRNVKCSEVGLVVTTETVYVKHEVAGTWHKIGQFKIRIGLDGCISFTNLSGRIKASDTNSDERWNLHAPHVFGDGRACFGTVEKTIRELCLKHEYAALVQVLIMFLSQANIADAAGKYVVKWPQVTEEEATGKKPAKAKRVRKVQKEAA